MAYVPPHLRTAASAAPHRETWEEAQRRMADRRAVPMTPAPAPLATVAAPAKPVQPTFEDLRRRAGPPPTVAGCNFVSGASEGASGGGEEASFDSDFSFFKLGRCPPPMPLHDDTRSDAVNAAVVRYKAWYASWGPALHRAWAAEHPPKTKTVAKAKPVVIAAEPEYVPKRQVEDAGIQSGW